jgi:heat shock protein HslJ
MRKLKLYEIVGLTVLLALTVLAGVSCAKNTGAELAGKTWVLKLYGQHGGLDQAITGHEPTLIFDKDKMTVGGSGGINAYGGDYTVDGSQISFKNVFQTLMASPDENLNKQESSYFKLLNNAETFKVEGSQLTIDGTLGTLIFQPE